MGNRIIVVVSVLMVLGLLLSCWKAPVHNQVIIHVPSGYSGPVEVHMGVFGAPGLLQKDGSYLVTVPPDGRVSTSTSLSDVQPVFKDLPGNRIWGYNCLILRSGDGIPVGGSIEFFVGTNEQYQIEVSRKHKSHVVDFHAGELLASLGRLLGSGA